MFSVISKKIFAIFFITSFFASASLKAWTGYDYDQKTTIEIEEGELVREGLTVQFYDYNSDDYHTATIHFIESVTDGTRIELRDLDAKKERIFIMQ